MRIIFTLCLLFSLIACFAQTANTTKGCAPVAVLFSPPGGAVSSFWTFNDGGTSTLNSPSNIFTTPGTYTVEYRSVAGGPVLGTITITVYPKPVPNILATPSSGCAPLEVQFEDTTLTAGDIQILGYGWVFGDGSNVFGTAEPLHTYTTVGAFTVSLELTTNYPTCNVTRVFADKIKTSQTPNVAFVTNPTPPQACMPPLQVSFTNTTTGAGPLTYSWDLGNGITSTLSTPPTQTYTDTGNYVVKLTATNALGCAATSQQNVTVGNPLADFNLPDTVCVNAPVPLENLSTGGQYAWNFGSGAMPATSTQSSPEVVFSTPGTKQISLTVTAAGGCLSTKTRQLYVDKADASFSVTPTYSCNEPAVFQLNALSPAAAEWRWTFSNGDSAAVKNPVFVWYNPDSLYSSRGLFLDTVLLMVTNPSGCTAQAMRVDTIWRPNARFMPDKQHGCAPLAVTFADSSSSNENIVEWNWNYGDGSPAVVNTTDASVTHTFTNPGEYNVRLIVRNSRGCIDTSYNILIEVGAPIAGDFTADVTELCPGDSVHFTNLTDDPRIDGWHFSSDSDRLWHCFQNANPAWAYTTATGPMDVALTIDYNGCLNTVTKNDYILVKGPIAKLHYQTTCDNTLRFDFMDKSSGATQIKWFTGDGDSTLQSVFSHDYAQPGTYTVILQAANPATGCPVSYDTATVYPTQLKADFELPYLICGDIPRQLDATASTDVNATCHKGYTWYFTFQRPIRTDEASMEYVFGPSGPQTVWLEVEDINGCKDTLRNDIYIYNNKPQFAVDDSTICVPGTVRFTDLSTSDTTIVSWSWDFGDGTTSTEQNPQHTYTTPPPNGVSFQVTLQINDEADCPKEVKRQIQVYVPNSIIATLPQPPNICAGSSVVFSASDFTVMGSNLSWQWDFGNGATTTGQTVQQTFNQAGTILVTVNFTEIATGCMGSSTVDVRVQEPPQAAFTSNVDAQSIICYPQNINLTSTSQSPYLLSIFWDLGNGLTPVGPTAATAFQKGTYTVSMVAVTPYGCADTTQRTFVVVGPEGDFTTDKSLICTGGAVVFTLQDTADVSSYTWDFGDGNTVDLTNPISHTYTFYPPSGVQTAKLILRGEDDACTFIVSKPINFSRIDASFVALADPVCLGNPHQFSNTSNDANQFSWFFGDGATATTQNAQHEYTAEGDYLVTLIVAEQPVGCKDTTSLLISVTGLPNLQVYGDTICAGDTAMIGLVLPIGGATYSWTPANQVLAPKNGPNVRVIATQTTAFAVTVMDSTGCMDIDTALVFVPDSQNGTRSLDTIVAKGQPVTLPVAYDPFFTYAWSPSPGQAIPPIVTPRDSSLRYSLTITDQLGCATKVYTFNIQVVPQKVIAPNAFTPNGDGFNDVFQLLPDGESGLVDVEFMQIYDRWGELVFAGRGTAASVAWDGFHKGKPAMSDVFAWMAQVRYKTGITEELKGEIILLR